MPEYVPISEVGKKISESLVQPLIDESLNHLSGLVKIEYFFLLMYACTTSIIQYFKDRPLSKPLCDYVEKFMVSILALTTKQDPNFIGSAIAKRAYMYNEALKKAKSLEDVKVSLMFEFGKLVESSNAELLNWACDGFFAKVTEVSQYLEAVESKCVLVDNSQKEEAKQTIDPDKVPVFDPIKKDYFPKGTPIDYEGRKMLPCNSCNQETPHDHYRTILGMHFVVQLPIPFMRKSTAGKLGTKSYWAFCGVCGTILPLDEAAREIVRKAANR